MKSISLIFFLALCIAVHCNIEQKLAESLRQMQKVRVDASSLTHSCTQFSGIYQWNISPSQIDQLADKQEKIQWLRGEHMRQPGLHLKDLKFGTKIVSLSFENSIKDSISGVIAKAFVATKDNNFIQARSAIGTATCNMKQQFNVVQYKDCKRILFWKKCSTKTRNVPRGFHPHELNNVLNSLQSSAAQFIYQENIKRFGLRGDNDDINLQTLYAQEGIVLRRFYSEIIYEYIEMEDVDTSSLKLIIKQASLDQISDNTILQRIFETAQSADRSSIFYVPNNNTILVISINKRGVNFLVRMSTFKVTGRTPTGAFATSLGAWNLERVGQGNSPSSRDLLAIFPPLK